MHADRLTLLLLERGLVEREALARLTADASPEPLVDRLVSSGLVAEGDLLRLVAEAEKTRFVSSRRLEGLRLPADVLAFVPVEAAEQLTALPLSWDSTHKVLAVVVGDLSVRPRLDELPRLAHVQALHVFVGLPGPIRAAVARNYRGVREPAEAPPVQAMTCPQCAMSVLSDQLECGACGLLLNLNAPLDGHEARVVRALLSVPSAARRPHARREVHEEQTRRGFVANVTDDAVPTLTAGLEIVRSLPRFEAFVVTFVDGVQSIEQLAQSTSLLPVEVASVLASLAQRGVVAFESTPTTATTQPELEPVADAPPPSPTPPVPPPGAASPAPDPTPPLPPRGAAAPRAPKPAVTPRRSTVEAPPPFPGTGEDVVAGPGGRRRTVATNSQLDLSLQAALALEQRGETEAAITLLKQAVARAPRPAPLFNRLALVLLHQLSDVRAARELLEEAIALEPDDAVYRQNLQQVLALQPRR